MSAETETFDDVISNGGDSLEGRVVLRCEAIRARYRDEEIFSDVDLEVRAGETVALVVESEWGARLLPRIAIGLEIPDSGEVELLGIRLNTLSNRAKLALRHQVGYLFHNSGLIHNLSIWYNVALPALYHSRFADLRGVGDHVGLLIRRCGLQGCSHLRPADLDEEIRKRVALARAWVMVPPILVFEDPLIDIDSGAGSDLLDMALGSTPPEWEGSDPRPHNPGVLITSQGLHEGLFRYVDRMVIVQEGKVVFCDSPRDFDRRGKVHLVDLIGKREAF